MKKQIALSALISVLLLAGAVVTAVAEEDESDQPLRMLSLPDSIRGLNGYDVTYTYNRPDDLAEALQDISDYLEDQGGYLLGNEQQGEFIIGGKSEGFYQVTGDTVTVSINLASNLFIIKKEFGFYFDKPRDMSQAVESLKSEISKHKGTLTGTNLERQGSFSAKGVVGSYTVTDRVDVTITERPAYASEKRIESEVIEWFKGM